VSITPEEQRFLEELGELISKHDAKFDVYNAELDIGGPKRLTLDISGRGSDSNIIVEDDDGVLLYDSSTE
tara:strand:- start:406 stop:615 length:210 start_codon:yes stop_codon:yes gene_type:complete